MNFNLKRPCGNCPFLKEGAIDLCEGRLEGIIDDLLQNDFATFQCHKVVYSKHGGDWDDDGNYQPSGKESACMGAVAYLFKLGHTSVRTRLAFMRGEVTRKSIEACYQEVIDPPEILRDTPVCES